jgi:hypothetical protein
LKIEIEEKKWSETSFDFTFKYYHSTEEHHILQPSRLTKRGTSQTSSVTSPPSSTPTSASVSLAFKAENKTLDLSKLGPLAVPISIGCVRCETTGTVTIIDSNIQAPTLNLTELSNNTTFADIFGSGKAILQADNVTAHMELAISPQGLQQSITYTLIEAPLPVGIQVCCDKSRF